MSVAGLVSSNACATTSAPLATRNGSNRALAVAVRVGDSGRVAECSTAAFAAYPESKDAKGAKLVGASGPRRRTRLKG